MNFFLLNQFAQVQRRCRPVLCSQCAAGPQETARTRYCIPRVSMLLTTYSLKPENVLIDAEGFALLTDFGLSKENMSSSQRAKSLCGTAEYLAPEVLEKERAYGKSCDWWSFGCVIYEMLTGHPLFTALTARRCLRTLNRVKLNSMISTTRQCATY